MSDSNVRELPKPVDRAARPPAVILLADILDGMAKSTPARSILVAWTETAPDGDGEQFRFRALGSEAVLVYLAERAKVSLCAALFETTPTPTDAK